MSDEIRDVEVESEIALEEGISEDTVEEIAEIIAEVEGAIPDAEGGRKGGRGPRAGGKKKKAGGPGKRRSRSEPAEQGSDFIEKVVQVRRVTKVVKGGKKLSFRTTVIIGNEKGKVGVGVGKAAEVLIAIKKAISDARKNIVDVSTAS